MKVELPVPSAPDIDGYELAGPPDLAALEFDPTGRLLAVGHAGGVSVFDLWGGSVREQYEVVRAGTFPGPSEFIVDRMAFSADGRWLAAASLAPDNNGDHVTAVLIDRQTGLVRSLLPPTSRSGAPSWPEANNCAAVAVSADGRLVASMWRPFTDLSPSTLVVWDRRAHRRYLLRRRSRQSWEDWPFALSPAGNRVACVRPGALDVYALAPRPSRAYTKRVPVTNPGEAEIGLSRVGFSPDGARVIVAYPQPAGLSADPWTGQAFARRIGVDDPAETRVFDAASGRRLAAFRGPGGAPKVITSDGTAVIWHTEEVRPRFARQDLESGKVTPLVRQSDDPLPRGWAMDPHGRFVAWVATSDDGRGVLRIAAVSPASG